MCLRHILINFRFLVPPCLILLQGITLWYHSCLHFFISVSNPSLAKWILGITLHSQLGIRDSSNSSSLASLIMIILFSGSSIISASELLLSFSKISLPFGSDEQIKRRLGVDVVGLWSAEIAACAV